MSIHRESILQYIVDNPNVTRQDLIKEFNYISQGTVYKHVTTLLEKNLIVENELHKLKARKLDTEAFKFHPLISDRRNVTTISNAYYSDPSLITKILNPILEEKGEAIGKHFVDLFYLFQAVANSRAETNDTLTEVNEKELEQAILDLIAQIR